PERTPVHPPGAAGGGRGRPPVAAAVRTHVAAPGHRADTPPRPGGGRADLAGDGGRRAGGRRVVPGPPRCGRDPRTGLD
ncbi:hypothetical protein DC362_24315, partial [Acinetobacter nosocomialis]